MKPRGSLKNREYYIPNNQSKREDLERVSPQQGDKRRKNPLLGRGKTDTLKGKGGVRKGKEK